MTDREKYLFWLNYAIENQEEIKEEIQKDNFPAWNNGYLIALLDAKAIFNDLDLINSWPRKSE